MSGWRVLLVDDEEKVIRGIQRNLQSPELEVEVALSGKEGLAMMETTSFDVVVSDLRMPEMDGNQFLNQVCRLYPRTIRMILSGYAEKKMLIDSIGVTHQLLAKPCETEALEMLIRRALELRLYLQSEDLQKLITQIETLPSLPQLFIDLQEATQNSESTVEEIAKIIAKDGPMTARILQMANSSCFGVGGVNQMTDAIRILGITTIKSLVLVGKVFQAWNPSQTHSLQLEPLWNHSISTALYAKQIAIAQKHDPTFCELCYTAGLLHDIGKVVYLVLFAEEYSAILQESHQNQIPLIELERKSFGVGHPEVGAYLLGLWGLPTPIVEAVAFHHQPDLSTIQDLSPLSYVHLAEYLTHTEFGSKANENDLNKNYMMRVGLDSNGKNWKIQYPKA